MPLFRRKASRHVTNEPYPDYDDTRWRYHLRTNAIETDHYCNEYVESINADRKEAARLFKNNDENRARTHAESAIRDKRIVTALGALSPLSNALYQRSEPLAGYTSLAQVPEPARSGIVTIIFAAGHLNLKYLSETVAFLSSQFSPVHIEQIQRGEGELGELVNPSVRDALANAKPLRSEVDAEITSAVKEYFGVSVPPSQTQLSSALETRNASQQAEPSLPRTENEGLRNLQTTPLSSRSSEMGGPLSPQLAGQDRPRPLHDRNMKTPSPPRGQSSQTSKLYNASTVPPRYSGANERDLHQELAATVDLGSLQGHRSPSQSAKLVTNLPQAVFAQAGKRMPVGEGEVDQGHAHLLHERQQAQEIPEYLQAFEDSDEMVFARYEQLRSVISV